MGWDGIRSSIHLGLVWQSRFGQAEMPTKNLIVNNISDNYGQRGKHSARGVSKVYTRSGIHINLAMKNNKQ